MEDVHLGHYEHASPWRVVRLADTVAAFFVGVACVTIALWCVVLRLMLGKQSSARYGDVGLEEEQPLRILVVGAPGAGKSTMQTALHHSLGLPRFDADQEFHGHCMRNKVCAHGTSFTD